MKLVHLSDIHLTEPGTDCGGRDNNGRFALALAHALEHHGDAARIVISGDLAHWADAGAYALLAEAIAQSPVPVRLLVGNHDDRGAFLAAFPDHPRDSEGFVNHAETLHGHRLIYCDTIAPRTHRGHFCAARRAWLEAELGAAERALVFFHHHPLDIGSPSEDQIGIVPEDQAPLRALLERHRGRIRHIFFGHVHTPLSGTLAGIPFSGVPSTAIQGVPDLSPNLMLSAAPLEPAYRVVLLRGADTVIHQIPFAWDGPVIETGPEWQDWAKPEVP